MSTTLTATRISRYVGREGYLKIGRLAFHVKIRDVRVRFGTMEFLIEPVDGIGEEWVKSGRVRLVGKE